MRQVSLLVCCLVVFISMSAKERTDNNGFFCENKGQVIDQNHQLRSDILFYGASNDLGFFVKKNGVSYQLYKPTDTSKTNPSVTIQRVDISWPGANEHATIKAENPSTSFDNYYNVEVPVLNVKSYQQFRFENLYNGIDMKYYQQNGALKYDYIVYPHADYHSIQLQVDGAELSLGKDGTVQIKTPLGTITEGQPVAYQNGIPVKVNWVLHKNTLSFDIPDYEVGEELVIDPLVFVGSSNVPSLGVDFIEGATFDMGGNVYKFGSYSSGSYPYFLYTGFISKYDSGDVWQFTKTCNGNITPSSSYIYSKVKGAGVDSVGNVYFSGSTNTTNNIATTGAFQTVIQGQLDGFLIKMSDTGNIIWGTYLGGPSSDTINSCVVDRNGNVYLFGSTTSINNIATAGSFQPNLGGNSDAFLSKFNSDGQRVWGTYFGGSSIDYGKRIVLDSISNSLFIGGSTSSNAGITTPSTYSPNFTGYRVCFLSKFDTSGNRIWGSYYGTGVTLLTGLVTDNQGFVYLTGDTYTATGISYGNAFQQNYGGSSDGFLTKFDQNGFPVWGTYLGSSDDDNITGCAINKKGKIFLSGTTRSHSGYLVTPDAYQTSYDPNCGSSALFLEFDTSGNQNWGSYYCPPYYLNMSAYANGCYADDNNHAFYWGYSRFGANVKVDNWYYYRFEEKILQQPVITASPSKICDSNTQTKLSVNYMYGAIYDWYNNQTLVQSSISPILMTLDTGTYFVKVNYYGQKATSLPFSVLANTPINSSITSKNVSCGGMSDGEISVLSTNGGTPPYHYTLNGAAASANNINLPGGSYQLVTIDSANCYTNNFITIVEQPTLYLFADFLQQPCYSNPAGAIYINVLGGIPPYHYAWNNLPDTTPYLVKIPDGYYKVTVTDSINCSVSKNVEVQKDYSPMPSSPLVSICAVTVDSFEGKNRIIWERGDNSHASQYKIYREGLVANQYDLAGQKASSEVTTFLDSSSNPLQQSYRYKITETDSCSNEFSKSDYHQTIHLTANLGINGEVNLSWNPYEGISYNTQYIMRSVNGSAFVPIAQVSSTSTAYTDANPPAGQKDYRIDIDLPNGCISNSFQHVSSNSITFNPNGSTVHIFPNPTSGLVNIRGFIPNKIVVEDIAGKKVMEEGKSNEINIQSFSTGVYFILLYDVQGNCYFRSKLVKK